MEIHLDNNGLLGGLPENLGMLRQLKFLNLSFNQFVGEIPPSYGNLENLNILDLHRNRLVNPLHFKCRMGNFQRNWVVYRYFQNLILLTTHLAEAFQALSGQ